MLPPGQVLGKLYKQTAQMLSKQAEMVILQGIQFHQGDRLQEQLLQLFLRVPLHKVPVMSLVSYTLFM